MARLSELLELSALAYTRCTETEGWYRDSSTTRPGFHAVAWVSMETEQTVLSIRGTASARDALQDLRLLFGNEPTAWREGRALVARVLERSSRLLLTGHSLGGAYASALGAEYGLPTVTFNAPGMLHALRRAHGERAPEWIVGEQRHILEVVHADDWIHALSGPALGVRRVVGSTGAAKLRGHGPRALLDKMAEGLRRQGLAFVRRSLEVHQIPSLRSEGAGPELAWEFTTSSPFRTH